MNDENDRTMTLEAAQTELRSTRQQIIGSQVDQSLLLDRYDNLMDLRRNNREPLLMEAIESAFARVVELQGESMRAESRLHLRHKKLVSLVESLSSMSSATTEAK